MTQLPFALILFRLALAPIMLVLAIYPHHFTGYLLASALVLGILSDVFDGIIARKLKISTDKLRKWDSNVDAIFLGCTLIAAYLFKPNIVAEKQVYIISVVFFELLMYATCYFKFKMLPANHAYSAKLFAIFICLSLWNLFIQGNWGILFYITYSIGVLSYIDNLLIIILLKKYAVDTKVFWKALK